MESSPVATATAEKKATSDDVLITLGDREMPLADALKSVSELALAQAWSRGEVEFGRTKHCVTGRPGVPESKPTLIIENEIEWSGAKTPRHGRLAKVLSDAKRCPVCSVYKKYIKQVSYGRDEAGVERWKTVTDAELADGQEFRSATVDIQKSEAEQLMATYVRLTDAGLAALQA